MGAHRCQPGFFQARDRFPARAGQGAKGGPLAFSGRVQVRQKGGGAGNFRGRLEACGHPEGEGMGDHGEGRGERGGRGTNRRWGALSGEGNDG